MRSTVNAVCVIAWMAAAVTATTDAQGTAVIAAAVALGAIVGRPWVLAVPVTMAGVAGLYDWLGPEADCLSCRDDLSVIGHAMAIGIAAGLCFAAVLVGYVARRAAS